MSEPIQQSLFDLYVDDQFPQSEELEQAIELLSNGDFIEARGAVFTKPEIVNFILDLVGYKNEEDLAEKRILEPSFGQGDFLIPIIDRLIFSWYKHRKGQPIESGLIEASIRAVELHRGSYEDTKAKILCQLESHGFSREDAMQLANKWLIHGDFLLEKVPGHFDFIVGNPPYVRQELIPAPLLSEYKRLFNTIYDRADLYIPFFERSLRLLSETGKLGFICSDRWMKNRYGGPLRRFIAENYHLAVYVDLHGHDVFHSDVSAYPGIFVIDRSTIETTAVLHQPIIEEGSLTKSAAEVFQESLSPCSSVRQVFGVVRGDDPWLTDESAHLELLRRIENSYPVLEKVGCKVGIGVATGADKAFIGRYDEMDVEADRKLPLVATKDIKTGKVLWQGLGVLNPFLDDGSLADLRDYPLMATYLSRHEDTIRKRHCAQKNPSKWYRTIDRIWPELTSKKKLLVPDIKGRAHVVYEDGKLYPHHNLYFIVSEQWNLRALQAVLLSGISKLFVSAYSTKMRGGYLRFQAQYIRRICVPPWEQIVPKLRNRLITAAVEGNIFECDEAVAVIYNLDTAEKKLLKKAGDPL